MRLPQEIRKDYKRRVFLHAALVVVSAITLIVVCVVGGAVMLSTIDWLEIIRQVGVAWRGN
jgi:arginine exporter protein ArgO